MSDYSFSKAQRAYDNQTPPEYGPTDEQVQEYTQTQEHADWMMENAGNGDWVAYEEQNYDIICEMAMDWFERNEPEPYGERI